MKTLYTIILLLLVAASASADRYWVGPVPWVAAANGVPAHYEAPAGVTSWVDFRTPSECGTAGTAASGVAVFVTGNATDLGANYSNLGTDPERVLTNPQRANLASALRMVALPSSNVLADIIFEAATEQADATGSARVKPLMPTDRLAIELWLGGRKLRERQFDSTGPGSTIIQQQLRAEYRAARTAVQNAQLPANFHRKIVGYWVRKYKLPYRWFEPDDLPDEPDIAPSTTVTDSFNRPDETVTTPWTTIGNPWGVVSNRLALNSDLATRLRHDTALSGADHYSQITLISQASGSYFGPAVRFASGATTCYEALCRNNDSLSRIYKCVAATQTQLTSDTFSQTTPQTVKLTANGTTLTLTIAGSTASTVTDSSISGNLQCGLLGSKNAGASNEIWDDFEAADLGGSSVPKVWPYYYRQSLHSRDRRWSPLFEPHFAIAP